MKEFEDKL